MINKNNNILLRIAQADAYAICVEYIDQLKYQDLFIEALNFKSYLQHPKYNKLLPGYYTDDTQQSIAISEVLINKGTNVNSDDFLYSFLSCFKRDERDGYSRNFQSILEKANSVNELKKLINTDSNSNGAAMRSVPLGIIKNPLDIINIAKIQAATTHNTNNAIQSSILVGLMSHFSLYKNDSFKYLNEWISDYKLFIDWNLFKYNFLLPWNGIVHKNKNDPKNLGIGINTAHAVNTLLIEENSLIGMMKRIINWGGDTDSVASIAWGIASSRYQDEILPQFMENDLENNTYGSNFLKKLGTQLMNINI